MLDIVLIFLYLSKNVNVIESSLMSKFKTQDMIARSLRNARPLTYHFDTSVHPTNIRKSELKWLKDSHNGNVMQWLRTVGEFRATMYSKYPKSFDVVRFELLSGYKEFADDLNASLDKAFGRS